MRQGLAIGLVVLFVAGLVPECARAQTVYSDGQAHTGSSPNSGPIAVQNDGTTLNVVSPAVVSGSVGVQNQTAIVGQAGTIINMIGGQVAGDEGAFGHREWNNHRWFVFWFRRSGHGRFFDRCRRSGGTGGVG